MNTTILVRANRFVRLGVHFLFGVATVALVYPIADASRRHWLKQRWSRQLLRILSVQLEVECEAILPGSLIVANHVSWLDIYAINAMRPVAFVSKWEVRSWPLIGWLAANTETLFIRRGCRRDLGRINAEIGRLLAQGREVALFPEGTTTDGSHVLPFHAALLQPAIDAGCPLQPLSLAYYDADGRRTSVPAYAGETTMWQSLSAILACRSLTVRLRLAPAVNSRDYHRRALACVASGAIAYALGVSDGVSAAGAGAAEALPTMANVPPRA